MWCHCQRTLEACNYYIQVICMYIVLEIDTEYLKYAQIYACDACI